MRNGDIQAEVDRDPFAPFRLHLVSGKSLDVKHAHEAWLLRGAVLLLRRKPGGGETYNVVAVRNIERLERIPNS